jgi:hypothetical protein
MFVEGAQKTRGGGCGGCLLEDCGDRGALSLTTDAEARADANIKRGDRRAESGGGWMVQAEIPQKLRS